RGQQLYADAPGVTLIRYPLDFSGAINRVLDGLHPDLVVLMELEAWPNFLLQCEKRDIDVILANGRITEPSFRKYRWLPPITVPMFRRFAAVCAQDALYARRFVDLGVPRDRVRITGTMKFDTAQIGDHIEGADDLARAVGL